MRYKKRKTKSDTPSVPKKSDKQRQIEKCDEFFSKYIRVKFADANGVCRCISCGKFVDWKKIQNGHYMSRRYMSTRWSEDNCRPQCVACNIFNQGAAQAFRLGLIKDFALQLRLAGKPPEDAWKSAENRVNLTEAKARQQVAKFSEFELKAMADFFKKEYERIKKEKGI